MAQPRKKFLLSSALILGLGLSLVKAVVEAHGGRVLARNAPNGGAEITVCLPLAPRAAKLELVPAVATA